MFSSGLGIKKNVQNDLRPGQVQRTEPGYLFPHDRAEVLFHNVLPPLLDRIERLSGLG